MRLTTLLLALVRVGALRPALQSSAPRRPTFRPSAVADATDAFAAVGDAWQLAPNVDEFDIEIKHEAPPVLQVSVWAVTERCGAFKMHCVVFAVDRGDAAKRDVDVPRATKRAERTKIDGPATSKRKRLLDGGGLKQK